MKLVTWNVNGIRAAAKKGFLDWLEKSRADVVCLQETKAHREQLGEELLSPFSYESHWFSAEKKGYSGVATYTKKKPLSVTEGIGHKEYDCEGRVQTLEFDSFFLVNAYFPNSQREAARLGYKLGFCSAMLEHLDSLVEKGKGVVLCGDYNISHTEIDLKNPKTNKKNAGFRPEEREWMSKFLECGYVDIFRDQHQGEEGHYTWWSYRPGVRERNIGWRLDYFVCNEGFQDRVGTCKILPEVMGSDHCPVTLKIK